MVEDVPHSVSAFMAKVDSLVMAELGISWTDKSSELCFSYEGEGGGESTGEEEEEEDKV